MIRKWRFRVTGILLVVGGTFGGLVGSLRFWSRGPTLTLKPWQWLIGPVAAFVELVLVGVSREDHSLFVRVLDPYMPIPSFDPPIKCRDACLEAIGLALLAAIVGWAGTIVVVAWRKLLPWTRPDQAADYDDRMPRRLASNE